MNKRRLLKLAEHLEKNVPAKEFNMKTWDCGTAACALGHACRIPEFNKYGLKACSDYRFPTFKCLRCFDAAAKFFGIKYKQSMRLFQPSYYRSGNPRPSTVARRIRRLVAEHTT